MKFLGEVPKKAIKTFENFGFTIVRVGNHISMVRENVDGEGESVDL